MATPVVREIISRAGSFLGAQPRLGPEHEPHLVADF